MPMALVRGLRAILAASLMALVPAGGAAAQTFATGARLTPTDYYDAIPDAAPQLPRSGTGVDLSRFLPPPGNQGSMGSCVGWAVAYATRSFVAGVKQGASWPLKSPSGQFSPAFLYNEVNNRTEGQCNRQGMLITTALQFTNSVGAVLLDTFGYTDADCSLRATPDILNRAGAYRIESFASLGPQHEVPLAKVIEALDAGRPVILAIGVDQAFNDYRGGVLSQYAGPNLGYHAIVAVGYDRAAGTLKLLNSWGSGWGENGTVRIAYATAQEMIYEGYVILDASALDRTEPQPTPIPVPTPPDPQLEKRYFDWFDAIEGGDLAAVRAGLDAGLRPEVEADRVTGLQLAIEQGNLAMIGQMLEVRPQLDIAVPGGNYLLLAMLEDRNPVEMTRALIGAGINPNILDRKGYSAMCMLGPDDDDPRMREIYQIIRSAGGRCLAPEAKFG
jgi:hypothetical protein